MKERKKKKKKLKKRKENSLGGAINTVRVCVKASPAEGQRRRPKAGDIFTEARLMLVFRVSTGLHVGRRPI